MKFNSIFMHGRRDPVGFLKTLLLLPKFIRLTFRLLLDKRVPLFPKIILIITLIYVVSPMDFIPEILLPIIGYSDDLLFLIFATKYFFKSTPESVMNEHVAAIEGRKSTA
ncbi:MAG: DUF1232 domain-containing protein [Deferribacteres bacterium]|nr:DUF1232 domain-containing protein [candidate division KSB1 bacterium]MCB9502364.1 DUF1232 domain-containing protein [Deferribacteres bacterium]